MPNKEILCTHPDTGETPPQPSCRELGCILLKYRVVFGNGDVSCIYYNPPIQTQQSATDLSWRE